LVGILRHKIIDHLRKLSSNKQIPIHDDWENDFFDDKGKWKHKLISWKESPEVVIEKQEFWDAIAFCVSALTALAGKVFTMRIMDETESN